MPKQEIIRDELITTLQHLRDVLTTVQAQTGRGRPFNFSDAHKITEGLFLSAWTHWEEFLRYLLVEDLCASANGVLRSEVKEFRTKGAAWRLSDRLLSHPDPKRWVEWSDFNDVVQRANFFLGNPNRFLAAAVNQNRLSLLKRMRNAVAHKSDRAWASFIDLVKAAPFALAPNQRKGITVGRFLIAHQWNGKPVLVESIDILENNANLLVP